MNSNNFLKFKRINFILFVLFLVINLPEVQINTVVSSVHIYLPIFILLFIYFCFYELSIHKNLINVSGFILIFTFFTIIVLFGRDQELIELANNFIPDKWEELYGKKTFSDFYRDAKISLFQLVNLFIFLIFFNFCIKNKLEYKKTLIKLLLFCLIFQFCVMFIQKYFFNMYRPTGTLGNSQSVGFFSAIVACYILGNIKGVKVFIFLLLVVMVSLLSGTRSTLAVLFILILFNNRLFRDKFRILSISSLLFISFSLTLILSYFNEIQSLILVIVNYFTSPLSMNVRFLMWGSFADTLSLSPLFGTKGITAHFTDNGFWYFILPYGFIGGLFLFSFYFTLIKVSYKNVTLYFIVIVLSIQSISYYGFFISNLNVFMAIILGLEMSPGSFKKLNEERSE